MMPLKTWWIGAAVLALWSAEVGAAPRVASRVQYYEVEGATVRELREQMNRLGPLDANQRRRDAYTHWQVNWTATYRPTPAGIAVGNFETRVQVVIYLPRWKPPENTPPELIERWNDFVTALNKHEQQHRLIGLQAAADANAKVAQLGSFASTEAASAAVRNAVNDALRAQRDKEAEYDRTTRHGTLEGARFP